MCKTTSVEMCTLFVFLLNLILIQICFCAKFYKFPVTDLNIEKDEYTDYIAFPDNIDVHKHHPYYNHHHHHHNLPPYPRMNENNNNNTVSDKAIPIDFMRKFNAYENVSDLLLNFVDGNVEDEPFIGNRFGEEERNAAIMAKAAGCMPELQTVKISPSSDPSVLYIPTCTRVERCGGCCSHSLLACQPKVTETVSFQVIKTQFTGGSKLKYVGKEIVLVEKHMKCKCDCKVQEKDCSKFQVYRPSECKCACINADEEKKCYKNNATKLWNPDICACQCRDLAQCTTGYTFDHNNCKCVPNPMRRRFAENPDNERSGYKSDASSVVPLYDEY